MRILSKIKKSSLYFKLRHLYKSKADRDLLKCRISLYKKFCKEGDLVFDIGANIGTFSLYAAKVGGASRVLSFEPFPDNYRMLSNNVERNQLHVVTCVNQAVAGSRGIRTLRLDPSDSGSHGERIRSQ